MTTPTRPKDAVSISETVYFSDGNIVLDVVEEEKTMRYRLHKSVLELNSRHFEDLFGGDESETAAPELVDGVPVISLTGDKIADWDIILYALYDPFFSGPQPIATIIAMLRIGKKYEFGEFLADAESKLRELYPSTLRAFRSRTADPLTSPIILDDSGSLELLAVAEENILPDDILPTLYFDHFSFLVDLESMDYEDELGKELISPQIRVRLLLGHRRLLLAQAEHTFAWLKEGISCHNNCRIHLSKLKKSLATPASSGTITLRPFATFSSLQTFKFPVCAACEDYISSSMKRGAISIWRQLPSYFGLGTSWDDLIDYEESGSDEESDSEGDSDFEMDEDDLKLEE